MWTNNKLKKNKFWTRDISITKPLGPMINLTIFLGSHLQIIWIWMVLTIDASLIQ